LPRSQVAGSAHYDFRHGIHLSRRSGAGCASEHASTGATSRFRVIAAARRKTRLPYRPGLAAV
jgi:hypothetical protein